jgi:hypothetical protein
MHNVIEEELLNNLKWLTAKHKLKECESDRLKNILIKIAQSSLGDRFDSGENVTDDELKYGVWNHPNIHSYLTKIPHSKVFKLFEGNSITKIINLELYFYDFNFAVLFYTNEELSKIIKLFIPYLLNNRNAIITTGFPLKVFGSSYWFDKCLSCLYPVKMPSSVRKIKDQDGNLIFEYHWSKLPKYSDDFPNLEQQDYFNSPNIKGYSLENIDFIENKRPMLFDLKIEILNILANSLFNKNYSNLWDQCLESIADKMTIEDFNTLNEVGKDHLLPASLSGEWQENPLEEEPKSDLDWVFRHGGIFDILDLIYEVEKELRFGYINKIKHKLLDLGKNKKLSTYFDLILNFDISYLFTIAEEYLECKKREHEFRNFFIKRLLDSIEKSFRVPLLVKPNEYNKILQFVEVFETNQSLTINFPETERIHKAHKKNITPLSLPPNTKWEHIIIQFLDYDRVVIKAPNGFSKKVNFREMGFEDERGKKPNVQWKFFYNLALLRGDLTWTFASYRRRVDSRPLSTPKAKKWKQRLSDALKDFFLIDGDPFYDYKRQKAYKTKFSLLPEPFRLKNLP